MSSDTILALMGIAITIAVSFFFWILPTNKKLDLLKEQINKKTDELKDHISNKSPLSYQQSEVLIGIYLEWVRIKLEMGIHRFFDIEFEQSIKDKVLNAGDEFIDREAMDTINATRDKFQSFLLPTGISIQQFLDIKSPIHADIIQRAKEEVRAEIRRGMENPNTKGEALNNALRIALQASADTSEKLKKDIYAVFHM